MLPFSALLQLERDSPTAIYLQIATGIVKLIQQGVLKPGGALPGSREMAGILKLHRKTVVAAYEELSAQDWIQTIPRKAVIVSQKLPVVKPRSFKAMSPVPAYAGNTGFNVNTIVKPPSIMAAPRGHRYMINDGFPDPRIAPMEDLLKEYRRLFHLTSRKLVSAALQMGSDNLRKELTDFFSDTRGLNIGPNNIMITRGAQMAIYVAASLIVKPGDTVLVGESNYFMADMIFQQLGARLVRIPVDDEGMDISALEKICKRKKPTLLYIIPHHHHPTTVTLSAERRMQLLQLIREFKFAVIEDDYDYDFHYSSSPILPLASADHGGNVVYIGSLTKTLANYVRIGYLIAPENFIREASSLRRIIDIRGDSLLEDSLAILYQEGIMQRHLKKSVKLYKERRDKLTELLNSELGNLISFKPPDGGMATWVRFQKKYPLASISARASSKGLLMNDGSNYSYGGQNHNGIRFGFAGLNEKEMRAVIEIVRSSVQ